MAVDERLVELLAGGGGPARPGPPGDRGAALPRFPRTWPRLRSVLDGLGRLDGCSSPASEGDDLTEPPSTENSAVSRHRAAAAARDRRAIGRYRVVQLLGQGGFGQVYLAHDDELDRPVAIKVPNPERIVGPEDVEAYLAEARTLARLDHPNIVPVYDVGRTDDGLCYVVSKFVEGSDLAERLQAGPALLPGVGRARGRRSPRRCTTPTRGPGPPRRQARQHPARRRRASPASPTSAGAEGRGLRQGRRVRRDARLHEPRAGPRRGAPGRRPLRHLQPGRRLLRAADRPQAVPGRHARRESSSRSPPPSRARRGRSTTRSPGSWSGSA